MTRKSFLADDQNIGFVANLKSVLGPNPLLWLWPQPMRGDGLSFPVNPEAGGESANGWADIVAREQAETRGSASGGQSSGSSGEERYRGRRADGLV